MNTYTQLILAVEVAPLRDSSCGIENLLKNRLMLLDFGKSSHFVQAPHNDLMCVGVRNRLETFIPATGSCADSLGYLMPLFDVYMWHKDDHAKLIMSERRGGRIAKMN
jgi:hypothetical protein